MIMGKKSLHLYHHFGNKTSSSPTPTKDAILRLQSNSDKICYTPAPVRVRLQSMLISDGVGFC